MCLEENLISTEKVKGYLTSNDFWIRRIAVVATVSLNQKARGGHGDSKRTVEICRLVVDDHNDMIVKALSWALRELAKSTTNLSLNSLRNTKIECIKRY